MRTDRLPADALPDCRRPFCCGCSCTSKPAHWSATHGSTCTTAEPRLSASGYLNGYSRARKACAPAPRSAVVCISARAMHDRLRAAGHETYVTQTISGSVPRR